MAWIDEGIDQENSLRLWRDSETGQYQYGAYGSNEPPAPLTPLPTGFSYIPATETTEAYYRGGTQSNPVVMSSNPNAGFDNQLAALNSLYTSYIGGDPNQLAQVINQFKDQYAAHGINAGNAAQLLEQNFYDRIHNVNNDDFFDNIMQKAVMSFIVGGPLMAAGGFLPGTGALGEGALSAAEFAANAGVGAPGTTGVPSMDWWNTDWGTEGLVDLGSSGYNAVAANDPIGALIQNLESGMTPSQAVSAVETALPGTTRSALEQFLYEAGVNSSNGISRLLGNSLGGQAANGLFAPTGESSSLLGILGKLAPSLLGAYASNQQTNALTDLAKKYQDFGAPYRQQLADITANPDNFYNSLGAQKATDSVLHKLSIGGNPSGSPYKQQLAVDSLWNDYGKERDRLAGFGGLTNYNAAAPNLETQAINSNANMYNAIGAGMNDIFNPKPALPDLLKQMKQAGF